MNDPIDDLKDKIEAHELKLREYIKTAHKLVKSAAQKTSVATKTFVYNAKVALANAKAFAKELPDVLMVVVGTLLALVRELESLLRGIASGLLESTEMGSKAMKTRTTGKKSFSTSSTEEQLEMVQYSQRITRGMLQRMRDSAKSDREKDIHDAVLEQHDLSAHSLKSLLSSSTDYIKRAGNAVKNGVVGGDAVTVSDYRNERKLKELENQQDDRRRKLVKLKGDNRRKTEQLGRLKKDLSVYKGKGEESRRVVNLEIDIRNVTKSIKENEREIENLTSLLDDTQESTGSKMGNKRLFTQEHLSRMSQHE